MRVFLTYGSFYTERQELNAEALAKFDRFLGMAEEAGIYVHPTGPDHWEGIPGWVPTDRLADEQSLQALEDFWRWFAGRYRGRSAVFAYDLLNEPTVPWRTAALQTKWNRWLAAHYASAAELAKAWNVAEDTIRWDAEGPPPLPESLGTRRLLDYQHFREEIADEWTRRQAAAIKAADPEALVTVGMIQWSVPALLPGVQQYAAFRPERQAPFLDFLEIHFYPLAKGFYEYSPDDEAANLAYLESITRETAKGGKPVVLAEFGWYGGGSPRIDGKLRRMAGDEEQARWCRLAVETTHGLATGWLNWGFYDHPESRDVSQLTGLLTSEGQPKAWSREFRSLAAAFAQGPPEPAPRGPRPDLDWDRCIVSPEAGREFLRQYTEAFQQDRRQP